MRYEDEVMGPDPRNQRHRRLALGLGGLGVALIVLWVGGWAASFRRDRLVLAPACWVEPLPMIAGDFLVHIDHVARLQARGIDPYHKFDDWVCFMYPYPPMIARCFAWVVAFEPATAAVVWQGTLGLIVGVGGFAAVRARRELGLEPIPGALLIAAALFTTPVLFAVERGQSDPMIIPALLAAAGLLRRRGAWTEVGAGALLGLTAWLKYYPGLAVVALLGPVRPRALAAFVGVVALVGIVDRDGVRESIRHGQQIQAAANAMVRPVHEATHSLVENWQHVKFVRRSPVLRQIPGAVAAAVLLVPAVVVVARRVGRSPRRDALLASYLLWLASAATFGLPYSNDYNLAPLPIAALMVWGRRDRWGVHLFILASVLWSQPFRLPLNGEVLLALKLAALYGVAASLVARASRDNGVGAAVAVSVPGVIRNSVNVRSNRTDGPREITSTRPRRPNAAESRSRPRRA